MLYWQTFRLDGQMICFCKGTAWWSLSQVVRQVDCQYTGPVLAGWLLVHCASTGRPAAFTLGQCTCTLAAGWRLYFRPALAASVVCMPTVLIFTDSKPAQWKYTALVLEQFGVMRATNDWGALCIALGRPAVWLTTMRGPGGSVHLVVLMCHI
jgi:hypothetical protein